MIRITMSREDTAPYKVITPDGTQREFETYAQARRWLAEERITEFKLVMPNGFVYNFKLVEPFSD